MKHEKLFKTILIVMETIWLMLLLAACVAFFQVITARAEDQPIAIIYQDEEQRRMNAKVIDEAPPINRISEALDEQDANGHHLEYLGKFFTTYYCPCRACNGSNAGIDRFGNPLKWGTIAVDPKIIPLHTKLVVDGYDAVFEALDVGGDWVQGNHIDIFVPVSHSEALAMCKDQWVKVWRWVE